MKPMLSATVENVHSLRYPLLASPKLDGIRCVMINGEAHSRNMKPIPNTFIRDTLAAMALPGLDGELIVGDPKAADCFNRSTSGVMSRDGTPQFCFWVFDRHDMDASVTFTKRLGLTKLAAKNGDYSSKPRKKAMIQHVAHKLVGSAEELLAYEAQMLLAGCEGVMVRDPLGSYKFGRSTLREGGLAKLKRFTDAEAEVIGAIERQHNGNEQTRDELGRAKRSSAKAGKVGTDTLGALQVRDCVTGVEFEIGTGFTDLDRDVIWAIRTEIVGDIVKYKSQPVGAMDKPRFPVFLGFRDPIDI